MDWPAFGSKTVKRVLAELGHEVSVFDFPQQSDETRHGEELGVRIAETILATGAEIVFSFNFFPVIATAVHACRRKYISWVYDSPAVHLYSMTVFFPENYIFHFDSAEVERIRRDGAEQVWYLPLSADTDSYDALIPSDTDRSKYRADVTMIGSMYREKFAFFEKYTGFDDHLKGYLDAVVAAQEQIYGDNFLERVLTPEIMDQVVKTVPLAGEKGDSYDTAEWNFANYYLGMLVTANEREHLLGQLSECCDVALYTTGKTPELKKVRNLGTLDYYREAPLAIKCAKINLNITLRSIKNGIPQRAMDIMGCGGFLLSNYQADLCDAFAPDEDFVFYESAEDAVEKVRYYLAHEGERQRIAESGYRKVKAQHGFREKCEEMLRIANS